MPNISNFMYLITSVFLLGYWVGIFLLSYHLIRFGVGTHPRRIAFLMIIGSVFLTILTILLLVNI